jgi:hypothetical protein
MLFTGGLSSTIVVEKVWKSPDLSFNPAGPTLLPRNYAERGNLLLCSAPAYGVSVMYELNPSEVNKNEALLRA